MDGGFCKFYKPSFKKTSKGLLPLLKILSMLAGIRNRFSCTKQETRCKVKASPHAIQCRNASMSCARPAVLPGTPSISLPLTLSLLLDCAFVPLRRKRMELLLTLLVPLLLPEIALAVEIRIGVLGSRDASGKDINRRAIVGPQVLLALEDVGIHQEIR